MTTHCNAQGEEGILQAARMAGVYNSVDDDVTISLFCWGHKCKGMKCLLRRKKLMNRRDEKEMAVGDLNNLRALLQQPRASGAPGSALVV